MFVVFFPSSFVERQTKFQKQTEKKCWTVKNNMKKNHFYLWKVVALYEFLNKKVTSFVHKEIRGNIYKNAHRKEEKFHEECRKFYRKLKMCWIRTRKLMLCWKENFSKVVESENVSSILWLFFPGQINFISFQLDFYAYTNFSLYTFFYFLASFNFSFNVFHFFIYVLWCSMLL